MKHFFHLCILLILSSCGNSNFLKQKYTDLKTLPSEKSTQVNNEPENEYAINQEEEEEYTFKTSEESSIEQNSYKPAEKNEFNPPISENNIPTKDILKPFDDNYNSTAQTESSTKERVKVSPQKTEDEDEERDVEARNRINYILALLVIATIFTYFARSIVGFAFGLFALSEVLLYLAVGMALVSIIVGILAFVQAMKLREIKEKSKETVYMYFGLIGGLVLAASALLQIFSALLFYIL